MYFICPEQTYFCPGKKIETNCFIVETGPKKITQDQNLTKNKKIYNF